VRHVLVVAASAWVAVVGTAVGGVIGGLIGFMTNWYVQRSERADRIAERSRTERKDAYAALLTHSEDSMHLFEWLAQNTSPTKEERDKPTCSTTSR
jgi:hypothetical protein